MTSNLKRILPVTVHTFKGHKTTKVYKNKVTYPITNVFTGKPISSPISAADEDIQYIVDNYYIRKALKNNTPSENTLPTLPSHSSKKR